jgi:N-acetylmuramoyl-L-alanine amidase
VFKKKLYFESRGFKFSNSQVLRKTVDYCPSVLLELGFVDNRKECYYFLMSQNIKALSLAAL